MQKRQRSDRRPTDAHDTKEAATDATRASSAVQSPSATEDEAAAEGDGKGEGKEEDTPALAVGGELVVVPGIQGVSKGVSSTRARAAFADETDGGASLEEDESVLMGVVLAYIREHGLYVGEPTAAAAGSGEAEPKRHKQA